MLGVLLWLQALFLLFFELWTALLKHIFDSLQRINLHTTTGVCSIARVDLTFTLGDLLDPFALILKLTFLTIVVFSAWLFKLSGAEICSLFLIESKSFYTVVLRDSRHYRSSLSIAALGKEELRAFGHGIDQD